MSYKYQHLPLQDLPKVPKLVFLVRKYTIWQPWRPAHWRILLRSMDWGPMLQTGLIILSSNPFKKKEEEELY
jgi:hypothetical protein